MPPSSTTRQITIFDTTLRDGEQSPGCSMNLSEKLEVAQALADLGVNVIEAGFPITSVGDFEAVREIAKTVSGSTICGLARCRDQDIDRAWEALQHGTDVRIHVFLATSAIHREFKLKMDKEEIIRRAVDGVKRAKKYCDNIEFSPEDAARTESDFLCEVVEAAIEAGATTVNIPDTVGYATPAHFGGAIDNLMESGSQYRQSRYQLCTVTTISAWRWQTVWPQLSMVPVRLNALSTASAKELVTARWRKLPWQSVREATTTKWEPALIHPVSFQPVGWFRTSQEC